MIFLIKYFMNVFKTSSSCKFLLQYHFIFVCKYRRKLLNPIKEDVKNIMKNISFKYNFEIHTQEIDKDHIHMHIESIPSISPSQICRVLKQESTITLWKRFPKYLKKFYWKEKTLWSDGWFCSSIENVSEETLRKYIENQG